MEQRITDLGLAAFLSVKHPLKQIVPDGNDRAAFIFEDSPALQQDCLTFLSRRAFVEPVAFLEQVRTLRGGARCVAY